MAMSAASSILGYPTNFGLHARDQQDEPAKPSYVVPSKIIESTQSAIELYRSGQKLWRGSDLERIEYELSHSRTTPSFTIRRIDGSTISMKNPMFGIANPIWKPYVKFQHYWYLFKQGPKDTLLGDVPPHSIPYFSYYIGWENRTFVDFVAGEHGCLEWRFQKAKERWGRSWTCGWLDDKLSILKGQRKITKVLCFGLGDMTPLSRYDTRSEFDAEAALHDLNSSFNQHAVALSIAAKIRSETGDDVEIFAQDPAYSETSKALLEDIGIQVVGEHGAGGFSKIDYDSVVFFCYPAAPVRQIIADLARPAMIIGNGDVHVLNENQPFPFPFDAESPRTREMWEEYTRHDFKIMQEDEEDLTGLRGLNIYVRNDIERDDCVDTEDESDIDT
ncbi:uncharacterized protein GGS22DRAFT_93139 [Annulohypoxylon maeteangense]|uniref:uncharacterized protein n=1 Tax=Annulohypoxylon maeteangense TaxID=1927788 RepID=UPI002007F1ED|nr:uncharacterized protein GGS22DRAFT_93139 [Annulohypoxylon maeteangense]KAI0888081.1 hypothetical protein GGS22DRAFT_93139 [Annulohypoxylon maeteangense]